MESCWFWSGSYYSNGYGQAWSSVLQRGTQAHRLVYEGLVGPIPEGLQLDHLCRVRGCVNPKHLRVVTSRENVLAKHSNCRAKANSEMTECKRGHAFDEVNTYHYGGMRHCRICRRDWKRSEAQRR